MKRILYTLIQCTWGIIQTLIGFIVFLIYSNNRHYNYQGSIVTEWKRLDGLSLGLFIFIPSNSYNKEYILKHEYGHTIQSLLLGPLYLLIIGLPSLIWNRLPRYEKKRMRNNIDYYDFYTERSANYLGKNNKKDDSM